MKLLIELGLVWGKIFGIFENIKNFFFQKSALFIGLEVVFSYLKLIWIILYFFGFYG